MAKTKIQVGPGTGKPLSQKKGLYAGRSGGAYRGNGGFGNEPTVTFETTTDKQFLEIFGNAYMPKWKKDLLAAGESLE